MQRRLLTATQACTIVAAACIALRSVLFNQGIPAFQHDWIWSPLQAQLQSLISDRLSLLQSGGLQGYNVDALSYAPLALANGLAMLFSSRMTLSILLALFVSAAAWGAAVLSTRHGARAPLSLVIGLLYALGPVFVNKLGSGQINAWCAYAALPWAFVCIEDLGRQFNVAKIAALALCGVFIASQIHVFAVFCLCAVVVLIIAQRWAELLQAVVAMCLAIGSQLFSIGEALYAYSSNTINQYPARIPWELDQSPHVFDAVGLTGYYARYFETMVGAAFPWIHWAQVALGVIAFAALLLSKSRMARAMALIGAFIVLIVSSFHTPLEATAAWVFERFQFASLFRELYNLEEILAVVYCIGLSRALLLPLTRAIAAPIMILMAVVYILPSYGRIIHMAQLDRHARSATYVASKSGTAGVWPVPNGRFLINGASGGGYDPFQGRLGLHPVVEEYFSTGPIAVAASRHGTEVMPLLRAMGIGYIWCRTGLLWKPPSWARIAAVRLPCEAVRGRQHVSGDFVSEISLSPAWRISPRITLIPDVWSIGLKELSHGDFVFAKDATVLGVDEEPARDQEDLRAVEPAQGVIPQVLGNRSDPRFSEIADSANIVAARYYNSRPYVKPAYRIVVGQRLHDAQVLYKSSTYKVAICRVLKACASGNALSVVSNPLHAPISDVRLMRFHNRVVLINNQLYRPSWQASVRGEALPHFRVNGFANGWLVDRSDVSRIAFSDRSQDILRILRMFSIGAVGAIAVMFIASLSLRFRGFLMRRSGV